MNLKTIKDLQSEYESNKCAIDDLRLHIFVTKLKNAQMISTLLEAATT